MCGEHFFSIVARTDQLPSKRDGGRWLEVERERERQKQGEIEVRQVMESEWQAKTCREVEIEIKHALVLVF